MLKIPTLFTRNPASRRVIDELSIDVIPPSMDWVAYEKLPGATVRLTVRGGKFVRLEVRRPPSKDDQKKGITEPWWREAGSTDADYWLWEAARGTNLYDVPDGEWAGEAIGEKIQGNLLGIVGHRVVLFGLIPWRASLGASVELPKLFERAPLEYDSLSDWLPVQHSGINTESGIEGVVWWMFDEPVAKIKQKDFTFGIRHVSGA